MQEPDPGASPGPPRSCCGDADGFPVRVRPDPRAVGGWDVLVPVDPAHPRRLQWVPYPKPVAFHGNPTGRNWVWYTYGPAGLYFFCLRLATGT